MREQSALLLAMILIGSGGCAPAPEVQQVSGPLDPNDIVLIELGRKTFREKGCVECHIREETGGKTAPNLDLIAKTADPTYVRESILTPERKIVPGFEAGLMPQNYGSLLTEAEIDALQYYLSNEVIPAPR